MPKTPYHKLKDSEKDNKTKTKDKSKKRKRTTSADIPGSGMAKKAGKAIEKRHKMLKDI